MADLSYDTLSAMLHRPIAFHPVLAQICDDDVAAGIFLSQAFYWYHRTRDPDGWFYKTQDEWYAETRLNRRQQERVRQLLKTYGFLEEKRVGAPARLWYRLVLPRLLEAIDATVSQSPTLLPLPLTPDDLDEVATIYRTTLRNLSRAGYQRAKELGCPAEYVEYEAIYRRDQGICQLCQTPIRHGPGRRGDALQFDHIAPLGEDGTHTTANLQSTHARCKLGKHTRSAQSVVQRHSSLSYNDKLEKSSCYGLSQSVVQRHSSLSYNGKLSNKETEITAETTEDLAHAPRDRRDVPAKGTGTAQTQAPRRTAYSEDFEAFWCAYPLRKNKGEAWEAWQALGLEGQSPMLVASVQAHWEHDPQWQEDDGKYIPYPATYLKKTAYLDELPAVAGQTNGHRRQKRPPHAGHRIANYRTSGALCFTCKNEDISQKEYAAAKAWNDAHAAGAAAHGAVP